MLAFAVLDRLVRVAAGTVLGCHNRGDGDLVFLLAIGKIAAAVVFFVVLGHILIARLRQMAIQASDVRVGMAAVGPVAEQTGIGLLVALDASHGLGRDAALDAEFLHFGIVGLCQSRRLRNDQHQRNKQGA